MRRSPRPDTFALHPTPSAILHDYDALRLPYSDDLAPLGAYHDFDGVSRAFALEDLPHHVAEVDGVSGLSFWVRFEDEERAREIIDDLTAWERENLGGPPSDFTDHDFEVPDLVKPEEKNNRYDMLSFLCRAVGLVMGLSLVDRISNNQFDVIALIMVAGCVAFLYVSWLMSRQAEEAREYWEAEKLELWGYEIHPAEPSHLSMLAEIERAAAELFPPGILTTAQRAETVPLVALASAQKEGRLWIATLMDGTPFGFALVERAEDTGVLAEMSVHPEYQRRGIGAALIEEAAAWADDEGYGWLTLTTFADVSFNAPWYERLGFERVAEADLSPDLARRLADEEARGLRGRVAMRLVLG